MALVVEVADRDCGHRAALAAEEALQVPAVLPQQARRRVLRDDPGRARRCRRRVPSRHTVQCISGDSIRLVYPPACEQCRGQVVEARVGDVDEPGRDPR